jgi:phosphate-selective porin OprO/OprP
MNPLLLWGLLTTAVLTCASVNASQSKAANLFSMSGYLMLDYDQYGAFYNKDSNASQSHVELRRSKLSIAVKPNKKIKGVVQVKYSREYQQGEKLEFGNVYLNYGLTKMMSIRVGRFKEPFNLEQLTSSKNLAIIERSLMTDAFSLGSNVGLMLYKNKKAYTWALGVFEQEAQGNGESDPALRSMTARMTYLLPNARNIWHFGGTFTHQDLDGDIVKFNERGEVNSAQKVIRSARFNANDLTLLQVEGAFSAGGLRLQTHAAITQVEQIDGRLWQYSGFDIQASYLLSGEHYAYKKGRFKGVKSHHSNGSWELVSRYSHLDLQDNDFGSKASISLLGVNYYYGNNIKIMANVLLPNIEGNVVNTDQSGNAVSIRAQYTFNSP